MPGQHDVWNLVTSRSFLAPLSRVAALAAGRRSTPDAVLDTPAPGTARRTRALRIGALATVLVLATGGSVAFAGAHKTVTLDVDGEQTTFTTFSGSVDGVLAAHGIEVDSRDLVAPAPDEALRDGDEVVVRHARQVTVVADGEESRVWTTALDAGEVLASLSSRGEAVSLVASRSAATGRAELPVPLDGPVEVVVDGRTEQVADGAEGLDAVLAGLDVTIGELDRVQVHAADGDAVRVVVQRVVAEEQTAVSAVAFETVTQPTDELYEGRSRVAVEGVAGERTVVHRVVLVDGVEESRVLLGDAITRAPVTEVVEQGTKERPAPAPAPVRASTGGSSSAAVVTGDVWAALAQCESGGNPKAVSASGTYYGLYQFSLSTWASVGGSGLPTDASPAEQTQRAQALQARSGWGQWPHCSSKLGLR